MATGSGVSPSSNSTASPVVEPAHCANGSSFTIAPATASFVITANPPPHEFTASPLPAGHLEHELRLSRHPVWLGPADGQHEPDLQIPRRRRRPDFPALARRAPHRLHRATDHRCDERPHLGTPRTPPS